MQSKMKNNTILSLKSRAMIGILLMGNAWGAIADNLSSYNGSKAVVITDRTISDVAKKTISSVVNISASVTTKNPLLDLAPFFGPHFFDRGGVHRSESKSTALGTGFVIKVEGNTKFIITNYHVIDKAEDIKISFTEDSSEVPTQASLVGSDPELDIALIRVDTNQYDVKPLVLGNSDTLEIGAMVVAVGNPYGRGHSVTVGWVSQKNRVDPSFPLAAYIQTQTPINPGNSGGPLLNLDAEVIGVNNSKDPRGEGLGFAIPINAVKLIIEELKEKGSVSRAFLGVDIQELTQEIIDALRIPKNIRGPMVATVMPQYAAALGGVKPYDIITGIETIPGQIKKISNYMDLKQAIGAIPADKKMIIHVARRDSGLQGVYKAYPLEVRVGSRPKHSLASAPDHFPKNICTTAGMQLKKILLEDRHRLNIPDNVQGVLVQDVALRSPAFNANIKPGDVIVEISQKKIYDIQDCASIMQEKKKYMLRVYKPSKVMEQGQYVIVVLDTGAGGR